MWRWRRRQAPPAALPSPPDPPPALPTWANELTTIYDRTALARPYAQPQPKPIPPGGVELECDG